MKRGRAKIKKSTDPEFIRPEPVSKRLWNPENAPSKVPLSPTPLQGRVQDNIESLTKAKFEAIKRLESECNTTQKLLFLERQRLFDMYTEVILTEYFLCTKYELESRQWKCCVYNLFCASRKNFVLMNQTGKDIWNAYFISISQKYEQLIKGLMQLGLKHPVWSRCYSHMGDLARYRFQFLVQSHNLLTDAKLFYNKARTLAPKNGLYYNQLGLVSRLEGNITETVHHHLRALCLERPLDTARETLLEVFQVLVNSEADIRTFSAHHFLRLAELKFLRLIKVLYTKIGVEDWVPLIDDFSKNLSMGLDELAEIDISRQFQFCFYLAVIPMAVFQNIQSSRTFDSTAKTVLQKLCFELIMLITAKVAHIAQNPFTMFLGLVLSWVGSNEVALTMANDLKFKQSWGAVLNVFNRIAPTGFREQAETLELKEIYRRTENLTEDLQLYGFLPFKNFIKIGEWNYMDAEKMKWEYEFEAMSMRRTARVILLVVHLDQKLLFADSKGNDRGEDAKIFKFHDWDQEITASLTAEDFDDEQHQRNVGNYISVDKLVQDIEVSSDAMELKKKLHALAQEATVSQAKNLVLGETILVFDTNIFLRGISGISLIIESKKYPVVVPLPVITELTGLSENDTVVKSHAFEALEYLNGALAERLIRIQTAKGNFIDSILNIPETWDPKHTNADDVILDICRMHNNVCLITDDANLRLKCRTVGVLCLDSIYKIRP